MTETAQAAAASLHPWRGIAAAIVSVATVGLGMSLSIPLLSLTLEARGVSPAMIGINTATWGLASIIATPFVPRLAARFGTTTVLVAAALLSAAALPLFYLAGDLTLWFPLRFVTGAAMAATFILSEFWINAVVAPARRGAIMGVYATVLAMGFAAGPLVLLATGTGGALPFLVGAAILTLAALPVLAAWRQAPRLGRGDRTSFSRFLLLVPTATAAALVFGALESGNMAMLPLFGQRLGHLTDLTPLLPAAFTLGNVAMQVPLGLLSDRVDRRRLLQLIALGGTAGAAALPAVGANLPALLAVLFLWGGVTGGLYTIGLAHLGSRYTGGELAAANSAFVFCYSSGALVGPAALGGALDVSGPLGFGLALALMLGAYLALVTWRLAADGRPAAAERPVP